MRMTILTLGLSLAMAAGLAGQALAGDRGGYHKGHGQGHRPPAVVVYPAYRPRSHGWHRHHHHAPRAYRPRYQPGYRYRHHDGDERWGVHLFYGRG